MKSTNTQTSVADDLFALWSHFSAAQTLVETDLDGAAERVSDAYQQAIKIQTRCADTIYVLNRAKTLATAGGTPHEIGRTCRDMSDMLGITEQNAYKMITGGAE